MEEIAVSFLSSHTRSLATEGSSGARLSSPQRLKPIHVDC
jgi:hypothetical protein